MPQNTLEQVQLHPQMSFIGFSTPSLDTKLKTEDFELPSLYGISIKSDVKNMKTIKYQKISL